MTDPAAPPGLLDEAGDAQLRRDIRRLGDLLGETLARQESPELVDQIEEIRRLSREALAGDRKAQQALTKRISTADLPTAYRTLLPDLTPPRAARSGDFSPSAVVWHLGVRGDAPPEAVHHNIHFGHAWGQAFEQLIKHKELMSDPSRLVTIPTVDAPAMAPPGHSVLYVLEPVPNLTADLDWAVEGPRLRERLLVMQVPRMKQQEALLPPHQAKPPGPVPFDRQQ